MWPRPRTRSKERSCPARKGGALPGLAKKGKQLLDPKAKQLVGAKGAQRPSDEGQDRQGQARHKGQAHHQGQDRQRARSPKTRSAKDKLAKDKIGKDKLAKDKIGKDKLAKDKVGKDKIAKDKTGKDLVAKDKGPKGPTVKDKGVAHQVQDRQGSRDQDRPRPVCARRRSPVERSENPRRAPHRDRRRTGAAAGAPATRSGRLHRRAARHRDALRLDRDGVSRRAERVARSSGGRGARGTA